MKKFEKKSRVYVHMTTPSPDEILRQKEAKDLLNYLEKLKRKKFFILS